MPLDSASVPAVAEALRLAAVRLHQSMDAITRDDERWCTGQAADLLAAAGFPDLADRVHDACSDREVTALMNEIDAVAEATRAREGG